MKGEIALTPLEVSEILKISKNTVYELIKRGELNAYRVGNKVRVDMSDVEEYKNSTKSKSSKSASKITDEQIKKISQNNDVSIANSGFVICGQDIMLDILSRYLEIHPNGVQALRSYVGSYNGLYALYHGNASVATAHLWDGESDEYNVPYVKRMLPGIRTVIFNVAYRTQGIYVAKGNPKNIKGWDDLKRDDITLVNREKGSGTRVLIDENIKKLGIYSWELKGYENEYSSHLAVASAVARGNADFGVGNEKNALQVGGIDFIPMKSERYDLIIKKEDLHKVHFKTVIEIINSKEFRLELEGIGGYDLSDMGKIIAQT